jgi:hypothetical protein
MTRNHATRTSRTTTTTRGLLAAAALAGAMALVPVAGAHAAVTSRTADMDAGAFAGFDQVNESTGRLTIDGSRTYDGNGAAHARYDGTGANGFARGIFNVGWATGDDIHYGGAFFLPTGFRKAIRSQTDLMRWDNYGSASTTDYGGVGIVQSDGRGHLFRVGGYVPNTPGTGTEDMGVTPAFDLPEGRWFWLEVHQRLATRDGQAVNEVFIDDVRVASSTKANTSGNGATRLRYGIVAIGEGKQTTPLDLWFDRAMVRGSRIGALGGAATPPAAPSTPTAPGTTTPTAPGGSPTPTVPGGGSTTTPPAAGSPSAGGGAVQVRRPRIRRGRLSFRLRASQRIDRATYRVTGGGRYRRLAQTPSIRLTKGQRRSTRITVRVTLADRSHRVVRLRVRGGRVHAA